MFFRAYRIFSYISAARPHSKIPLQPCPSHSGKLMIHQQYSMSVDQLFTLLFVDSQITQDLLAPKGLKEYIQTPWEPETGQRSRHVTYVLAQPSGPIGPKDVQVTDIQIMNSCSKPGLQYSINASSKNYGIPYADNFTVNSHYCIKRVSENVTEFKFYSEVCFKKKTWGIIKAFIDRNTSSGIEAYLRQLEARLAVEDDKIVKEQKQIRRTTLPPVPQNAPVASIKPTVTTIQRTTGNPVTNPDDNSWLKAALVMLVIFNGLLCWKLYLPQHDYDVLANRINIMSEGTIGEDIEQWSSMLNQYRRQRGKLTAWRNALDATVTQLYQVEQAVEKLLKSIDPELVEEDEMKDEYEDASTFKHKAQTRPETLKDVHAQTPHKRKLKFQDEI